MIIVHDQESGITGITGITEWSRDDCPHNVKCSSERACNRYEAHKNRVRRSNGRDEG